MKFYAARNVVTGKFISQKDKKRPNIGDVPVLFKTDKEANDQIELISNYIADKLSQADLGLTRDAQRLVNANIQFNNTLANIAFAARHGDMEEYDRLLTKSNHIQANVNLLKGEIKNWEHSIKYWEQRLAESVFEVVEVDVRKG